MKLIILVKVIEYDYDYHENIGIFENVDLAKKYISDNFLFPVQKDGEMFAFLNSMVLLLMIKVFLEDLSNLDVVVRV